ncbi:hypothetical protein JYU14_02580 [Simkania negevensis]|uniref:Lipoprotein n=1 Tax=Simkania negevensis TaxID=83561 RepID=A0ABS3AR02_9BACT|nr:hypothetical protein [Simkania negevensis]
MKKILSVLLLAGAIITLWACNTKQEAAPSAIDENIFTFTLTDGRGLMEPNNGFQTQVTLRSTPYFTMQWAPILEEAILEGSYHYTKTGRSSGVLILSSTTKLASPLPPPTFSTEYRLQLTFIDNKSGQFQGDYFSPEGGGTLSGTFTFERMADKSMDFKDF